MRIKYIDGRRLYYAVLAGSNSVIEDRDYLNKINVFPVADADTGTNLASTMQIIKRRAKLSKSLKQTLSSIAQAAISGARGNSGLIFAQFLAGLSLEIKSDILTAPRQLAEAMRRAAQYARQAVAVPVEGTMLTIMKEWAEFLCQEHNNFSDFYELLTNSLKAAERSLKETKTKLSILAKEGVVDAGAKGFYDFIQGIIHFMKRGSVKEVKTNVESIQISEEAVNYEAGEPPDKRYCLEALIETQHADQMELNKIARQHGNSVVVAGINNLFKIHIHTNEPALLFTALARIGQTLEVKADDMKRQFESIHSRLTETALLTDSTCDLPDELLDRYQIHLIPFYLAFDRDLYLDRITISPDLFYDLLRQSRAFPKTSQPSQELVQRQVEFLVPHYKSIVAIAISDKLTGLYNQLNQIKEKIGQNKLNVVNSNSLSAGLGLIVLRAAEASTNEPAENIARLAEQWAAKLKIFVDVKTLKYLVKGGRVSRAKGLVARILNLKPILSLDDGKAVVKGQSFSRRQNMKKIIKMIQKETQGKKVWNYAIVHAQNPSRAAMYARQLEQLLGLPPVFISPISPVIGAHNGPGVVGIALMFE